MRREAKEERGQGGGRKGGGSRRGGTEVESDTAGKMEDSEPAKRQEKNVRICNKEEKRKERQEMAGKRGKCGQGRQQRPEI
jgi:hypothetical protein